MCGRFIKKKTSINANDFDEKKINTRKSKKKTSLQKMRLLTILVLAIVVVAVFGRGLNGRREIVDNEMESSGPANQNEVDSDATIIEAVRERKVRLQNPIQPTKYTKF